MSAPLLPKSRITSGNFGVLPASFSGGSPDVNVELGSIEEVAQNTRLIASRLSEETGRLIATEATTAKEDTLQLNVLALATLDSTIRNTTFDLSVSRGLVPGISLVRIMGHNPDVDTVSLPEDIWEGGGLYPFQTSAQSLEILSNSAADAAAGTGMRTVNIEGLNAAYVTISETVTLNGVAPVALVNQYLRINSVIGVTAGSGGTNAGVITLRVSGGGATQAVIDAGDGRAHQAIYTVPAGKTGFITWGMFQMIRVLTAESVEISLHFREAGGVKVVRNLFALQGAGTSSVVTPLSYPVRIPEKMDMWGTVSFVSANNISVSATLFLLLVDN